MQIIRIFSLIFLCFTLAQSAAQAEVKHAANSKRVALVIGNSRYESSVGALRNTVNDARVMAQTLRALGFTVIEEHNVTRDQLLAAMLTFRGKLRGMEVAVFYYAGHGISVGGSNYLLPVKSGYSPESPDPTTLRLMAETKLFNAEQAVAEMSNGGAGCNLVILDACRVTPVARNPVNRDATNTGGLVEMNPPAGSLIAFATDAGHVASDGDGANGLYTSELIKHLKTPGITIEQVFKRTRAGVLAASNGTQVTAEYSRLIGDDIYLAGRPTTDTPEEIAPKPKVVPIPTAAELRKLAAKGNAEACIKGLRQLARSDASFDPAPPLSTLLEQVKESLRNPESAAPKADAILGICDLLVAAVADCVAASNPQQVTLSARTHNRRGDALLLLGRNEEALEEFNTALTLTPNDAYVLYNRGAALLRMDRKDEARADFMKVAEARTKQPGARKLAAEALAKMQ